MSAAEAALRPLRGSVPALLGGLALAFSGGATYWDIATHVDGGRERFLTPPHVAMYSGVTLALMVIALAMVADRLEAGGSLGRAVLHPFRDVRPGLAAAGTGMAITLAAAPFDNAWHEIYGIDITIWSPPHLLAIFGVSGAALGLSMLVAPAARTPRPLLYHFLLGSFLGGLIISTGEFEFNGPQYRIAFHPIILSAVASFVLCAASGSYGRWSATRVALLFEGTRLLSLMFLVALGHSLPFVPLLLPTAVVIDLLRAHVVKRPLGYGSLLGGVTFAANWALLEALGGLAWAGGDLVLGGIGAIVSSAVAAAIGTRLGSMLNADHAHVGDRMPTTAVVGAAVVLALIALPATAFAHDIGGDRGSGTITWKPSGVAPEEPVPVEISDLTVTSGARIDGLVMEAWRAEHRIGVPLSNEGGRYTGAFALPEEGPWVVLIRVRAGDEALLATRQLVVEEDAATSATRPVSERFTLGLDALATEAPPGWVDVVAYGIAFVLVGLLLRGTIRSVRRLEAPRDPVVPLPRV